MILYVSSHLWFFVLLLAATRSTYACRSDQFLCDNGNCVHQLYRCTGTNECGDGSDEEGCTLCSGFLCDNGRCILFLKRCNGNPDCTDDSDEMNCGSSCLGFLCSSGQCISSSKRCDRSYDCTDHSDESNCCDSNEFQCDSGECIPEDHRCDQDNDCEDGSDEDGCVNVGLAVGLSVGGFFVFLLMVFLCGITIYMVYRWKQKSHSTRHAVTATTHAQTSAGAGITRFSRSSLPSTQSSPRPSPPPPYNPAFDFPVSRLPEPHSLPDDSPGSQLEPPPPYPGIGYPLAYTASPKPNPNEVA